jgi:hypothetical protein
MYKLIFKIGVSGIIFLGLYAFLRLVVSCPEEISILIVLLLFLSLHSRIDPLSESTMDYLFLGQNRFILKALDHFDTRLNDISHYHELLSEFYHLFNNIFPEKSWLFYVFEDSSFRMIKYDTSKVR